MSSDLIFFFFPGGFREKSEKKPPKEVEKGGGRNPVHETDNNGVSFDFPAAGDSVFFNPAFPLQSKREQNLILIVPLALKRRKTEGRQTANHRFVRTFDQVHGLALVKGKKREDYVTDCFKPQDF